MNQLREAVEHVANYGGEPMTFHVGDDADIRLADGEGHLLAGATIAWWPEAGR